MTVSWHLYVVSYGINALFCLCHFTTIACCMTWNISLCIQHSENKDIIPDLKLPFFPYATIRNNALMREFCPGLAGLGQKVTKSLSNASLVISFLTSEKAKWLRLLTA
ncbi:hypothetical protein SAMN05421690_106213 [Nitrosomonas sp. Nm51]|nr:hypothetical protein SAMN05421690_106213 [Nitrosomonas sp. Nm51]